MAGAIVEFVDADGMNAMIGGARIEPGNRVIATYRL
jgi:hypothetical protein